MPVEQIIQYELNKHGMVFRMGYADGKRECNEAGRMVEGE